MSDRYDHFVGEVAGELEGTFAFGGERHDGDGAARGLLPAGEFVEVRVADDGRVVCTAGAFDAGDVRTLEMQARHAVRRYRIGCSGRGSAGDEGGRRCVVGGDDGGVDRRDALLPQHADQVGQFAGRASGIVDVQSGV